MLAGEQFGRYEIREKIGEGGMGEVYSAVDRELDRSVAIKLLPSEFTADEERRSRFRQEAKVVSALNHPNVITIYEVGENGFGHFLATEFVEGRTLREIVKRESLTLTRILRIVEQAANGLVAAHSARIVHRDIKPENIMVRRDGIVKVLDFGLAKPVVGFRNEQTSGDNKTVPGTVMGSSRYMSPEQARGLEVDERTDIWSLGVVLYELLVGKPPFDGDTTADTLAAVIYEEPAPISSVLPNAPIELQRIVRKALQKDREERYQSVKDLALDVKDLLYDLEHANSGKRLGHITSNPDISENPTIIHRTLSGNHPTDKSSVITAGTTAPLNGRRSVLPLALAAVFGVLILAAGGYALYSWGVAEQPLAASAFHRPQMVRINTDGRVNAPAISPDGKYVAYVSGEVGNRSLVVRQVSNDSLITVVPATNLNIHSVSFAPNGDYVYYCQTRADFAINTLFQVPTLGGTPRKLLDDVDSPVTFSPDGKRFAFVRYVSATNEHTIFTVDASTMSTEQLISTKSTDFEFFTPRIAWSPDGRNILLAAGRREGGFVSSVAIAELSLAEKKLRTLNDDHFYTVSNFAWFADGSGFLCAGRQTQTSPVQIWKASYPDGRLTQVTNDFNDYWEAGLSEDGKTILTLKGDTISAIWRVSPDGKEIQQLTTDNRNMDGLSGLLHRGSDGSVIYTHSEGKEADLWVADPDGKNGRPLLDEKGFVTAPVITPDGSQIVYNLQRTSDRSSRIWRMNADGSNPVQLTEDTSEFADFNPQVTPDGKTVVFQRSILAADRMMLMKIPITGGKAETLYADDNWSIFQPRLSPDGKRMAFLTYNVHTWEKKIRIATLDGDRFGTIERDLEYNLINNFMWAPDGKSLTAVSNRSGVQNVWRLPIDGSAPVQMTDFRSGRILNFTWAADGRNLLVARGNTNNDLILIRDQDRDASLQTARKVKLYDRPNLNLFNFMFGG